LLENCVDFKNCVNCVNCENCVNCVNCEDYMIYNGKFDLIGVNKKYSTSESDSEESQGEECPTCRNSK